MRNDAVARRYARAIFELATEARAVDDVLQALNNLHGALRSDVRLIRALNNPFVPLETKQKLFATVTSNKLALKFLTLLARRKRLDLLGTVHDYVMNMNDEANGVKRPLVRTALPLTDDQRREVEKKLASTLGGKIVGRFETAADLIGGMWLQVGGKVLDATLRGRIADFRQQLIHSNN